jgi:hypothetical protein
VLVGATGYSINSKIQVAYHFIARNWLPGDEICIFGFSRGAYTARIVADICADLGILDQHGLEHLGRLHKLATLALIPFAAGDIYDAYQNLASKSHKVVEKANAYLKPWREAAAAKHGQNFVVQCLGVFDTVGEHHLPASSLH